LYPRERERKREREKWSLTHWSEWRGRGGSGALSFHILGYGGGALTHQWSPASWGSEVVAVVVEIAMGSPKLKETEKES
jgi:hypothetical protein